MSSASLLNAASTPPKDFHLPSTFSKTGARPQVKDEMVGTESNYRVLVENDGLTLLLPDKGNMRAMAGRRAIPIDRSFHGKYNLMRA